MECLNCNEEMVNNLVQTWMKQIAYDICEACGSLWLDSGELDKMAFQVEGSIDYCSQEKAEGISESTKSCVRCEDTTLDKVFFIGYSDTVLDRCRNCGGFWLDGGELDLINKELQEIMPVSGKGFSRFVNNVHLPYWYKRVRRKSSETDFTVEVLPIKNAELIAETEYICPACKTHLNSYTVFYIEVDGCPNCKGIWLDKDELRKLKDESDKDTWATLRWLDDEIEAIEKANAMPSKRECPKCKGESLISTSFGDSKILIDWCPSCHGTWLDRDEFQEIVDHLSTFLTKKFSTADMKKKLSEEIKEISNGPENTISEILDAKAARDALRAISFFEQQSELPEWLLRFKKWARLFGL